MSLSPDNCDTLMQNDVIDVNDEIANNSTGNETEKRPSTVKTAQDAVYDADSEMVESAEEEDDKAPKQEPCSDDDRSTVIAPISRPPTEPLSRHNLKWNLRVIISNLYMKSERRLPSACVPKCLHNTTQCVSRHRCAMLPDAPDISIAQELRNNLYRQHYDTYLDILETMALQSVYPDEAVFDRLIDMIMVCQFTREFSYVNSLYFRYSTQRA